MEVIGPDWRGFTGQMNHVYYSIGTIIASVLSYFFRSWRIYTYAVLAIHTPLLLAITVIPESPRWLFMKGQMAKGKLALRIGIQQTGSAILTGSVDDINVERYIKKFNWGYSFLQEDSTKILYSG